MHAVEQFHADIATAHSTGALNRIEVAFTEAREDGRMTGFNVEAVRAALGDRWGALTSPVTNAPVSVDPVPDLRKPASPRTKARHARPKQKPDKIFGDDRPQWIDREVKARIMFLGRALKRRFEESQTFRTITRATYDVLEALIWGFHSAKTGFCFPSYEKIAKRAGCERTAVGEAIKDLRTAGILNWVNRRAWRLVLCEATQRTIRRVVRTSNSYSFSDPTATKPPETPAIPSKAVFRAGPTEKSLTSSTGVVLEAEKWLSGLGEAISGLSRKAGFTT